MGLPNPEAEGSKMWAEAQRRNLARGAPFQALQGITIDENGQQQLVYRSFDKFTNRYLDQAGNPDLNFTPRDPASYGQYWQQARAKLGYAPGVTIPEWDVPRVQQTANDMQYAATHAGAAGTRQAAYEAPVTPAQSQQTQLPVGATGPSLAGGVVPTATVVDRRRTVQNIQSQLQEIKSLLGVLPRSSDMIGGKLPGAVNAVNRMLPQYRAAYAALDSSIDNIVNSLARAVGEQRGTQTEQDAERAYNTVIQIKGRLLDPTSGDTQESALARIAETEQYLQRVLTSLPAPLQPTVATPPPAAAGAGAPPPPPAAGATAAAPAAAPTTAAGTGIKNVNGRLYYADGRPFP
jgi:hypothetical protein